MIQQDQYILQTQSQQKNSVSRKQKIQIIRNCYNALYPPFLNANYSDRFGFDNINVNLLKVCEDVIVANLFKNTKFVVQNEKAQEYLNQIWKLNKKQIFLNKLALNLGLDGNAFIKLDIDDNMMPNLTLLDTLNVDIECDMYDFEDIDKYIYTYNYIDNNNPKNCKCIQQIIEENDNDTWTITDIEGDLSGINMQEVNSVDWMFDFSPIFQCSNVPGQNTIFGYSDAFDAYETLLDIQNVLSNIKRILTQMAYPKIWMQGSSSSEPIDFSIDRILQIPSKDTTINQLEMQSDLSSSLNYYKELKQLFFTIMRVPEIATGKLENIGNLSGIALSTLYAPLLQLIDTKRLTSGEMLKDLNEKMLLIAGFDEEVQVEFEEIELGDGIDVRNKLLLDKQLGVVSQSTISAKLGYDYELEQEKIANEQSSLNNLIQNNYNQGNL